jgi:hypothetical protein
MKRLPQRVAFVVSLVAIAFSLAAPAVSADAIYHSEHIALTPRGDLPLRTGFVENIHMNGPVVFAHENYVLNGAEPGATYQVVLMIYPNLTCSGPAMAELPTAMISTNVAGNGKAQGIFKLADVPAAFHNMTAGGRWELRSTTGVAYETACTIIRTD